MFLTILLTVIGVWLLVSVLLALAIGRAVKLADRNHRRALATKPVGRAQPVRARALAS